MRLKIWRQSYNERAYFVLSKFLSDFTEEELKKCIDSAYTKEKFETESIAPVYKLNDTTYFLELLARSDLCF